MITPRWTRLACAQCGGEYQATRSEPRDVPDDAMCPECDANEHGYAEGLRVGAAERDELREALRACAYAIDRLMGDTDLDGDDSPEYHAIRKAVALLAPHERADAPEVSDE